MTLSTLQAAFTLDYTSTNVRPSNNPYPLTITDLGNTPPTVSTTDPTGILPGQSGSLAAGDAGDGTFVVTLEGRNDESTNFDPDTWTGGTPHLVRGNSSGLGINDATGAAGVTGGEAILWSFDLSALNLNPGETLVMSGLDFNSSGAELWQLTGTPGAADAGTLIATGANWSGSITIADGDTFALVVTGRLQMMTFDIISAGATDTPTNLTATAGLNSVTLDWDDVAGSIDFYTVYRSTSSPVTSGDSLTTTATSDYVDNTAEAGNTYFYAVTATGTSMGESALSSEASATPLSPPNLDTGVIVNFATSNNIDPVGTSYPVTFTNLGNEPPSVSTTDASNDLPELTGLFADAQNDEGSFILTIQGVNNNTSNWDGTTWTGGSPEPVDGKGDGLGIKDAGGVSRVNGGEAILWSFDLSGLNLDTDESIVLTNVELDNGSAQFWQLTGIPGNSDAGTLVSNGSSWNGSIIISDGDTFALGGDGRLASMTLDIFLIGDADTPTNLTATAGVSSNSLDWDDDTSGALKSYTVYRSLESPVTADDALTTVFTSDFVDESAVIGVTYFYAVSATGTSGGVTPFSNEVSATPITPPSIQLLDADSAPVNPVTNWNDDSGNGNDALNLVGTVTYPSFSVSPSGIQGLDFGPARNSLELFSAAESDTWLDQSSSNNGFCILLAFKCDDLVPGQFNDLLGNSTDGSTGLQLGYTASGQIQATINGTTFATAGDSVEAGDMVIIALNYDAAAQTCELWESVNFTSVTNVLPKADFSTANPVSLGSIDNPAQFFNGMVGEVEIFSNALEADIFREMRERMLHRWVAPPNIVMLFVDDWAWNGSPVLMDERMLNSGMPELVSMPNVEMMAAQGMVFRNAYASPQCGPSRVCLQTGTSGARNGFTVVTGKNDGYFNFTEPSTHPIISSTADGNIRPDAVTIPEALAPMGYKSAHVGKWHMGGNPANEGYILHDGNTSNNPGQTLGNRDFSELTDPKLTLDITEKSLGFMEQQAAANNPFYVQMSYYAVHAGNECFVETRDMFRQMLEDKFSYYSANGLNPDDLNRNADPATWLGMAYEMDLSIGRVYDKLEELGIADNTYVILMSDNGFRHGFFRDVTGVTQPLHKQKWWVWQGGIRVPVADTGPGIPAGSYSTTNVANYDLLPTFVDWAGGDPTLLQDIDGISLKNLMKGETPPQSFVNRSLYFHYPHYRSTLPHSCIVKGNHKVMYFYETPVLFPDENPIMLFDLASDPGEYVNITDQNPQLAQELYDDLMNYLEAVDARIPIPNTQEAYNAFDPNSINEPVSPLPNDWQFYDAATYQASDKYSESMNNGFFTGTRPAKSDEVITTFSEYWMDSWGVDIGSFSNDFDLDGDSNYIEYIRGGNPISAADRGSETQVYLSGDNLIVIFEARNDDSNASYTVQTSPDLFMWTDTEYTIDASQIGSTQFDELLLSIPLADGTRFVRLSEN